MEFDILILLRLRADREDSLWTDLKLQSEREGGELVERGIVREDDPEGFVLNF